MSRDTLTAEFGGAERPFRLRFGEILDLEDACGGIGFGEIFAQITRHRWKARYLRETIKAGLIGGGMEPSEAEKLVKSRWDAYPTSRLAQLALGILLVTMEGIPPTDKNTGPAEKPFDQGKIFEAFRDAGITPNDIRGMRFKDFVLMVRAASGNTMQAPTEDEFDDMLKRLGDSVGYVDPEEAAQSAAASQIAEREAARLRAEEAARSSQAGGDTSAPEEGPEGAPEAPNE